MERWFFIWKCEASETTYWLEIIADMDWIGTKTIQPIIAEANEILAIFISIGKTLKL